MLTLLTALILAAPPAPADLLDDLVQRTAAVKSFTASYRMTSTLDTSTTTIRIDYQAPDKVRVDRTSGEKSTSSWSVGGVLALRSNESGQPIFGRVDYDVVYAELEPVEALLLASFPDAKARPKALRAEVNLRWWFDTKDQKANWTVEGVQAEDVETPFGWLETLRQKGVAPVEDGALLRFDTDDGAFQVALSRETGFVQSMRGVSPKGEMHLELERAETGVEIDAARFALPGGDDGRDVSSDLRRGINRSAETSLRRRIYLAAAGGAAGAPWDEAARAKLEPLLRAFHEHSVPSALESWRERADKLREGVTANLKAQREKGKSVEEVEAQRQKEIGYLAKQLDELDQSFDKRLLAPATKTPLPRADELLEIERRVVHEVFRVKVREPVYSEFDAYSKHALQ